jgi:hypothetical protein
MRKPCVLAAAALLLTALIVSNFAPAPDLIATSDRNPPEAGASNDAASESNTFDSFSATPDVTALPPLTSPHQLTTVPPQSTYVDLSPLLPTSWRPVTFTEFEVERALAYRRRCPVMDDEMVLDLRQLRAPISSDSMLLLDLDWAAAGITVGSISRRVTACLHGLSDVLDGCEQSRLSIDRAALELHAMPACTWSDLCEGTATSSSSALLAGRGGAASCCVALRAVKDVRAPWTAEYQTSTWAKAAWGFPTSLGGGGTPVPQKPRLIVVIGTGEGTDLAHMLARLVAKLMPSKARKVAVVANTTSGMRDDGFIVTVRKDPVLVHVPESPSAASLSSLLEILRQTASVPFAVVLHVSPSDATDSARAAVVHAVGRVATTWPSATVVVLLPPLASATGRPLWRLVRRRDLVSCALIDAAAQLGVGGDQVRPLTPRIRVLDGLDFAVAQVERKDVSQASRHLFVALRLLKLLNSVHSGLPRVTDGRGRRRQPARTASHDAEADGHRDRLQRLFDHPRSESDAYRLGVYGYRALFPTPLPDYLTRAARLATPQPPRWTAPSVDQIPKQYPPDVRHDPFGQPEVLDGPQSAVGQDKGSALDASHNTGALRGPMETPRASGGGWKLLQHRCAWSAYSVKDSPGRPRTCFAHPLVPDRLLESTRWAATALDRRWVIIGSSVMRSHFEVLAEARMDVARGLGNPAENHHHPSFSDSAERKGWPLEMVITDLRSGIKVASAPAVGSRRDHVPFAVYVNVDVINGDALRAALTSDVVTALRTTWAGVTDVHFESGPWELLHVAAPVFLARRWMTEAVRELLYRFPEAVLSVLLMQPIVRDLLSCNSPLRQRIMRDAQHAGILAAVFNASAEQRQRIVVYDAYDLLALRRTEAGVAQHGLGPRSVEGAVESRRAGDWLQVGDGMHYLSTVTMHIPLHMFLVGASLDRGALRPPLDAWDDDAALTRFRETREATAVAAWCWGPGASPEAEAAAKERFWARLHEYDRTVDERMMPAAHDYSRCSRCLDSVDQLEKLASRCHAVRATLRSAVCPAALPRPVPTSFRDGHHAALLDGMFVAYCQRIARITSAASGFAHATQ